MRYKGKWKKQLGEINPEIVHVIHHDKNAL